MYYSATFIVNEVEKNTWDDWKMIPNTPPMIPPPEPDISLVEVPGRSRGPMDLTGVAFDRVTYKRMTGSWTFYKEPETPNTRKDFYNMICQYFNGKIGKVILKDEDPAHFYVGRFRVSVPNTSRGPMTITISYDLMPARWNVSDNQPDHTYGCEDVSVYEDPNYSGPPVIVEWHEETENVTVIFNR